jgi:hypothetical protein
MQLQAELDGLRARNAVLEEDMAAVKKQQATSEFEDMSEEQLRDFIKTHTGHTPQGNVNRKTLVRMATDARPSKAA